MKTKLFIASLAVLVGITSGCNVKQSVQPATQQITPNTVNIENFTFVPPTIAVTKGTTVTWIQKDNAPHTATGSGFDSKILKTNESFSHTFNDVGTFDYICTLHPYMKGNITVNE